MEISHSHRGVSIISNGRRLQLITASVTEEGVLLSRDDMISYCQAVHKFNVALARVPDYVVPNMSANGALTFDDLKTVGPFVKYVPKNDLTNFVKEGKFQFGTIEYYQTMENTRVRDGHEGYANLFLNVDGRHVITSAFSGYNYLIFCGTSSSNSDMHKDVFGECRIVVPNIDAFCVAVKNAIGAKSYFVGKVLYDNFKVYETPPISIPNFSPQELFTEEMVNLYRNYSFLPSLYVKPRHSNWRKRFESYLKWVAIRKYRSE